jgi:hypothetical protein
MPNLAGPCRAPDPDPHPPLSDIVPPMRLQSGAGLSNT